MQEKSQEKVITGRIENTRSSDSAILEQIGRLKAEFRGTNEVTVEVNPQDIFKPTPYVTNKEQEVPEATSGNMVKDRLDHSSSRLALILRNAREAKKAA